MKRINGFFIFILLGILGIFLYIPRIYRGYRTLDQLQNELKDTTIQSAKLHQEMEDIKLQLDNFNNLYYIEKFARDKLSMKKKNETIYRVIYEEEQD
ncbi:septum formation initiator family protein [Psychrilyobacter sp.]|uniref:FtsB family cell division protein n=1 Tax=Psychrilyobacter sp. TaxID=2586924 RepID=UPI003018F19B